MPGAVMRTARRSGAWRSASSSTQATIRARRPKTGWSSSTAHPAEVPGGATASRRSFVFARAGFGKSNLIKLLFSRLYATDPVLESPAGPAKIGTIIFDPDGEYFWPDAHGARPVRRG